MKILTIDRNKWGRGRNNPECTSYLLNGATGEMCCLGFYALQHAGATASDIDQRSDPSSVRQLTWGKGLRDHKGNTEVCSDLMHYNDRGSMLEADREQKITELFATIDVTVEFVG